MRERDIQQAMLSHWRALRRPRTLVAAVPNARAHGQPGLTPGLPDLLVIGPEIGVGFMELKSERGRLSPAPDPLPVLAPSGGGRPASLLIETDGCRYPVDREPGPEGRHLFCNAPRPLGQSYCAEHRARCMVRYVRPERRRAEAQSRELAR